MWPFSPRIEKEPPPDLDERLEALERGFKHLRLEWEETYDKVHRLMGRIAKRAALAAEAAEAAQDAPGPPERVGGQLDLISQQVLARRRHGTANGRE